MKMRTNNGGYVAMLAVLMIATAGLFIAVTTSLVGIGEMKAAFSQANGEGTLTFIEGCTEDALIKAWASSSYNGGNITRPEGTCTVSISKVSTQWTITISTTATDYNRTIQVVINRLSNGISMVSWKEI
jgi:hypothetical protein